MTKPGPSDEALEREVAELEKAQAEATGWGAAVGARHGMLQKLYAERDKRTKTDERKAKRTPGAWRELVQEAIDLLCERKHGNPARSPAHNARLMLQDALAASPAPASDARSGLEEAAEWQPIDSAPIDGKPFLLFARHVDATASIIVVGAYLREYGWISHSFIGQGIAHIVPSHWRELPDFPRASETQGGGE